MPRRLKPCLICETVRIAVRNRRGICARCRSKMLCRDCGNRYQMRKSGSRYCPSCSRVRAGKPAIGAWRTDPIVCRTCKKPFIRQAGTQLFCSYLCRPSNSFARPSRRGLSETYLINGMTCAEYAFSRIMADQGITLRYLEPRSRLFALNDTSYTPDFYERRRRIYYEVLGTRQAYQANKEKYREFIKAYPRLTFKIVKPDGTAIAFNEIAP